MTVSRRGLLAGTGAGLIAGQAGAKSKKAPAKPLFEASWDSFETGYKTPDWFRDAKLGIWGHWGPQCVPEYGDWYGRQMYQQGNPYYEHHVATYGHPSEFGFMDFLPRWKAEKWDPQHLLGLYKKAGAKYFVAMANHHDNFDNFNSRYHTWNSTKIGPKRDIVGDWAKATRDAGIRFGVSNHSAHAWHWWQTAYGYDAEGPKQGVRYDAYTRHKDAGKGKWWEGLDPQELYTGPHGDMVAPDGIKTIKDMNAYTDSHSGQWLETPPPGEDWYAKLWLMRQKDLVEQYHPDFVYMDDYVMPLGQTGLDAVAHFYNANRAWNGSLEAVVTTNALNDQQARGLTNNVERGFSDRLRPLPWQTCTCIGQWHYDRRIYEQNGYKTAKEVIQRLIDTVSKNGTLLLSIPVRGNGEIDDKEEKVLTDMAAWMDVNGEAIFGTRPWDIYGEGPTRFVEGAQNEQLAKNFSHEDIRFTTKAGALYALPTEWPNVPYVTITSMAEGSPQRKGQVERVELLGHGQPLRFELGMDGLTVKLPDARPAFTPVLKIMGSGLTT
ncbi:alpha-L-fucosidase [Asticcacaulis solisilvae]|uniref:alpha-L-fucosidase n=1 Tax=Asticcacaulis solisilvae TaxID=1217274 RepID=UPI003FD8B105